MKKNDLAVLHTIIGFANFDLQNQKIPNNKNLIE